MLDQCHNIEDEDPRPDPLGAERAAGDWPRRCWSTATRWPPPSRPATCWARTRVLMDAYDTDVRPLLADRREARGPAPRPDRAPSPRPATPERIAAERVGGTAGRLGRLTRAPHRRHRCTDAMRSTTSMSRQQPRGQRPGRPVQPARRRPAQHQLRRRQHLRQGHRDRPGHRAAGRAAVGQGLRRRPRHADRAGPGRAAAGPAARAGRRLPGRGPRGRDGRRVRLLPARQGRRRAVDRHRDARAGRRRARRPPAPRLRHRAGHRRRRRGADRASASATGWSGCRGGGPASSSAWTSPRSRQANPQAIGCILGGHGITAWGDDQRASARPTRWRSSAPPSSSSPSSGTRRAVRRRSSPGYEPLPEAERRAKAAALAPDDPRPGLHRPAAGRPLHRLRRRARLPVPRRSSPRWPRWAPPARTTSCAPRSGRWSSTCRRPRPSRRSSPG